MVERSDPNPNDDGLPWGFIDEGGQWRPLPKRPMVDAGMGPPPFDVELPLGAIRHVIHQPEGESA